jgi:uncharacterized protein (DUF924 family)
MAFAGDPQALALSLKVVERGWLEAEPEQARRQFWLMPLMHSEDIAVQEVALPLFERFSDPRTAPVTDVHGLLRPPSAPSPSGGPGRRSSPGSGW